MKYSHLYSYKIETEEDFQKAKTKLYHWAVRKIKAMEITNPEEAHLGDARIRRVIGYVVDQVTGYNGHRPGKYETELNEVKKRWDEANPTKRDLAKAEEFKNRKQTETKTKPVRDIRELMIALGKKLEN